jgi:hypothetical protein
MTWPRRYYEREPCHERDEAMLRLAVHLPEHLHRRLKRALGQIAHSSSSFP